MNDLGGSTNFEREAVSGTENFDLARILAGARRQGLVVLLATFVGLGLGWTYLQLAVPEYTASARVLLDKSQPAIVTDIVEGGAPLPWQPMMASEAEVVKSDGTARKVIDALGLASNETWLELEATSALSRFVGNLKRTFGIDEPQPDQTFSEEQNQRLALAVLHDNLVVAAVGSTYVLRIDYSSRDPVMAAAIAKAFADAYLAGQLEAQFDAISRAREWLEGRMEELRTQSVAADRAVEDFRAANGLIETGGQLLSEQQLAATSGQLMEARVQTTSAKARLDRISAIVATGNVDMVVDEALNSTTINDLRRQYLEAASAKANIEKRVGATHSQAVSLGEKMADYQGLIFQELERIRQSALSTFEIASQRQKELEATLETLQASTTSTNEVQVTLRELERQASSVRSLYETILKQYQQSVQVQSLPVTDVRIIAEPTVPSSPSAPRMPTILVLSTLVGLLGGVAVGGIREFGERSFRTGDQVRNELGLDFLGAVPLVASTRRFRWSRLSWRRSMKR